ncbi:glycogen/starch synthase [Arthrobacter sp. NPDC093139]
MRSQRVLFTRAKTYPFVKVGGLADLSSAPPKSMAELGFNVRLLIPAY